jgi:hypothetical protein
LRRFVRFLILLEPFFLQEVESVNIFGDFCLKHKVGAYSDVTLHEQHNKTVDANPKSQHWLILLFIVSRENLNKCIDTEPNSNTNNEELQLAQNLLFSSSSIPIFIKLSIMRDVKSSEIPVYELDSMDHQKE